MRQPVSYLTQSQYYSPVFNAAIFDGPFRIYFAQNQEALALKIYFGLQSHLKAMVNRYGTSFREQKRNVFLMLYPNSESFEMCFVDSSSTKYAVEKLGEDYVLGIKAPLEDEDFRPVFEQTERLIKSWLPVPEPAPALEL